MIFGKEEGEEYMKRGNWKRRRGRGIRRGNRFWGHFSSTETQAVSHWCTRFNHSGGGGEGGSGGGEGGVEVEGDVGGIGQ